jgi:hypothetical protein
VTPHVKEVFSNSPWYADLIFVIHNLQAPPGLTNTKAKFLKLKELKYCILDGNLYWKDVGGILLNCLLKDEVDKALQEFHEGDCGSHLIWKTTANKILRAGFYWPTLFAYFHKKVTQSGRKPKVGENPIIFFLYVLKNYIHWKHQIPLFSSYNWKEAPTPLFLKLQPEGSSNSPIL